MENNKNIINGNCWVAYFDILGFRYIVKSFLPEFVRKEYKKALREIEKCNVICKSKFFSDTFIFYTENDSQDSYRRIRAASMIFFRVMFLRNKTPKFPMRGCLHVGQFYVEEEDGIFFGPALIDAYEWAEGQNWIGFVLSKKAREKLETYESEGFKLNNDQWFLEYEVPYKKEPKRLLTYMVNPLDKNDDAIKLHQNRLWSALEEMESTARLMFLKENGNEIIDLEKCPKYGKISTKYKNTRKFLLYAYPALKEKAKR